MAKKAKLADLVQIDSQLTLDVLAYLDNVAKVAAEVPDYYPAHLRSLERGVTAFDGIHQTVKLVTDRRAFDRWRAEEMERLRRAGPGLVGLASRLSRGAVDHGDSDGPASSTREARQSLVWDEHAAGRFPRAVILGDPGFGKTWLLRYEARRLAQQAAMQLRERTTIVDQIVVPIRLRLSELYRTKGPIQDAVVRLSCEDHSERFRALVQSKVGTAGSVLLLDGWDEVTKQRTRLHERLVKFARDFPQQPVLLASRFVGYGAPPIPGAPELELLPFDVPETESFVRVWFQDHQDGRAEGLLGLVHQNYTVRSLAGIPLMLALVCRVYEADGKSFPEQRGQLYEKCLRGLLRDWKEVQGRPANDILIEHTLERLRLAAFRLLIDGSEQFRPAELAEALGLHWLKRPRQAQKFIDELKADGLLIAANQDGSELLFLHRAFLEYLVAEHLGRVANLRGWAQALVPGGSGQKVPLSTLVEERAYSPEWHEPIVLLAGKLKDPLPLLDLLADSRRDDCLRHGLALATLCFSEVDLSSGHIRTRMDEIASAAVNFWWQHGELAASLVPHFGRSLSVLPFVDAKVGGTRVVEWFCEQLRRATAKGDYDAAQCALAALRRMGARAARAFPRVVLAVKDTLRLNLAETSTEVAAVLASMSEGVADDPEILRTITDDAASPARSWAERCDALEALAGLGPPAACHAVVLTRLLELHSRSPRVKRGPGPFSWVPRPNPRALYRGLLVSALGSLVGDRKTAPKVLPILLEMLNDTKRDTRERIEVCQVFAQRTCAEEHLPAIVDVLLARFLDKTEDIELRREVARAFANLGNAVSNPAEVFQALLTSFCDFNDEAGVEAGPAITAMQLTLRKRPNLISSFLHVVRSSRESQPGRQHSAIDALLAFGPRAAEDPAVIPTLLNGIIKSEWIFRYTYNYCAAVDAVANLTSFLSPRDRTRSLVAGALLKVAKDRDGDLKIRAHSAEALLSLGQATAGPVASATLADVVNCLCDARGEGEAWQNASWALPEMKQAASRYSFKLAGLFPMLSDREVNWQIRSSIARLLGLLSYAPGIGGRWVEVLLRITSDRNEDGNVREAAAQALVEFEQKGVRIFRTNRGRLRISNVLTSTSVTELSSTPL